MLKFFGIFGHSIITIFFLHLDCLLNIVVVIVRLIKNCKTNINQYYQVLDRILHISVAPNLNNYVGISTLPNPSTNLPAWLPVNVSGLINLTTFLVLINSGHCHGLGLFPVTLPNQYTIKEQVTAIDNLESAALC